MKLSILLTAILGLFIGCAKPTPEEKVYKEKELLSLNNNFASFDGKTQYLYVPMTLGTPRLVAEAYPFYQGQEKIVTLKKSKNGIEVVQLDIDPRFRDNAQNELPVLTLPGEYKAYRCKVDDNNECTHEEEENTEIPWQQKNYFLADYNNLKTTELNSLDIFTLSSPCLSVANTDVTQYQVIKGNIFIELEKTFKRDSSWQCIWKNYFQDTEGLSGFTSASFKVKFSYSIVKLDQLASANYESIDYPLQEHDKFGFFKNVTQKLGDDFDPERKEKTWTLNRWNPKNPEVIYYLSETFKKPQNKSLRAATFQAIASINTSLDQANAGFNIILKDGNGRNPGDLRNNMIVLIDDPLANGLLGYGPSVSNPLTGEIVQAHINMYGGVLKSTVRHTWDSMVDFQENAMEQDLINSAGTETAPSPSDNQDTHASTNTHNDHQLTTANGEFKFDQFNNEHFYNYQLDIKQHLFKNLKKVEKLHYTGKALSTHELAARALKNNKEILKLQMTENFKTFDAAEYRASDNYVLNRWETDLSKIDIQEMALKEELKLLEYSKNNAFSIEHFTASVHQKSIIPGVKEIPGALKANGILKRWHKLSTVQKEQAMAIILPHTYTSTFVHEMGHNLGLRHNFSGSFDKENFYSEEEAQAMGLTQIPAYSSIMDYAFSELNELPVFGKYDVAALRFAYAREVESANGDRIPLKTTWKKTQESLKNHPKRIALDEEIKDLQKQIIAAAQADDAAEVLTLTALKKSKELEINEYTLKDFIYCTDENAGLNSNCHRFDEGTSLSEIAEHFIQKYKDYYKYRNFRYGRNKFDIYGTGGYLVSRFREFKAIRNFLDDFEFFASIFGMDIMNAGCSPQEEKIIPPCKGINDRKNAAEIAGNFFLEVLKTPEHICLVKEGEKDPTTESLKSIYDDIQFGHPGFVPSSCFDQPIKDALTAKNKILLAENGKYLNGFKGYDPKYKYVSDRSTRGIWIDKVLASMSLFSRATLNKTHNGTGLNFTDLPAIGPLAFNLIQHLVLETPLTDAIPFKDELGNRYAIPYTLPANLLINDLGNGNRGLKKFLGLNKSGSTNLTEMILQMAQNAGYTDDEVFKEQAKQSINLFSVKKLPVITNIEDDLISTTIADFKYIALDSNIMAKEIILIIKHAPWIAQVDPSLVEKVLKTRTNPSLPAEYDEQHQLAFQLSVSFMEQILDLLSNPKAPVLTIEMLKAQNFSEQLIAQIMAGYQLGKEEIAKLISLKKTLGTSPPADAKEDEKKLYEVPLPLLALAKVPAQLELKVAQFKHILPLLPNSVHLTE